ncbi:tol-pal system protein YbgF [Rhizobacter sp. Root1221]|uniref:tol-pal system protein YbgF n=1 Tax=Rhizobacter sp. Root1221 TaxID=1736433 RepID=UPI000AF3C4BD|nr:tol-pal system protein YbgF [Rhizobacter sp. Root1221]
MTSFIRHGAVAVALAFGALISAPAQAALFDDTEARKAIIDLRTVVAQLKDKADADSKATAEQIAHLQRSLLDLNRQLEEARADNARLRGQSEQLARDVSDLQRVQKDIRQGVDDRIRKLEPQTVSVDGREFLAEPEETRLYEEAMNVLRKGSFAEAADLLSSFQRRYPASGYAPSALFWLGNAQYGKRDFKESITAFRSFVSRAPDHPRAPEALLSVANSQSDLKDTKAARRTLEELLKTYPKSEAAVAAKERLASLR